jgi:hypothetical protein
MSHATEDKADFVNDLVAALEPDYDVWYDSKSLKLGDSLFQAISKGIKECDYGVVVLSKAYFAKHWTQEEIRGLESLQTEERKVILPIWKDVSFAEVRDFSPLIADKYAAKASDGIPAVVKSIEAALAGVREMATITPVSVAKQKLLQLSSHLADEARTRTTLNGMLGSKYLRQRMDEMFEELNTQVTDFQTSSGFKFTVIRRCGPMDTPLYSVDFPFSLIGEITLRDFAINEATFAKLQVTKYRMFTDELGHYAGRKSLTTHEFSPLLVASDKLKWISAKMDMSNEEIPGFFLTMLVEQLLDESERQRRDG